MTTPNDALRCSRCNTFHSDTVNCPPAPTRGHTPLPWAMVYGDDGHHHILADDGPIADVKVRADADEQDANANILLAAPELLACLRRMCGMYGAYSKRLAPLLAEDEGTVWTFERANGLALEAIAKAEGR